jgi:hypothetical protein
VDFSEGVLGAELFFSGGGIGERGLLRNCARQGREVGVEVVEFRFEQFIFIGVAAAFCGSGKDWSICELFAGAYVGVQFVFGFASG